MLAAVMVGAIPLAALSVACELSPVATVFPYVFFGIPLCWFFLFGIRGRVRYALITQYRRAERLWRRLPVVRWIPASFVVQLTLDVIDAHGRDRPTVEVRLRFISFGRQLAAILDRLPVSWKKDAQKSLESAAQTVVDEMARDGGDPGRIASFHRELLLSRIARLSAPALEQLGLELVVPSVHVPVQRGDLEDESPPDPLSPYR